MLLYSMHSATLKVNCDVTCPDFTFPLKLVPNHCKNLQAIDDTQDFHCGTILLRIMPFRLGDHVPQLTQRSSSFPSDCSDANFQ